MSTLIVLKINFQTTAIGRQNVKCNGAIGVNALDLVVVDVNNAREHTLKIATIFVLDVTPSTVLVTQTLVVMIAKLEIGEIGPHVTPLASPHHLKLSIVIATLSKVKPLVNFAMMPNN